MHILHRSPEGRPDARVRQGMSHRIHQVRPAGRAATRSTGAPRHSAVSRHDGRADLRPHGHQVKPESWLVVPREFAALETPARKLVFDVEVASGPSRVKNM